MNVLELIQSHYREVRTVEQIIADLAVVTDEQRSLAWSPMPPPEYDPSDCRIGGSRGIDFSFETLRSRWVQKYDPSDCRIGGSCGIDFSFETPRSRWVQARHRFLKGIQ